MLQKQNSFIDEDILENKLFDSNLNDAEKDLLIHLFYIDKSTLQDLNNTIDEIYKDGVIDYHDIPTIISFISRTIMKRVPTIYSNIDIYAIIKLIVEVFILTYNGKENINIYDIITYSKMIDSSIELLKINHIEFGSNKYFCCCKRKKKN